MKALLVVALAATALTSAAPALAQSYGPPASGPVRPGHGFREQLEDLETRVQQGIRMGQIDPGEASRANRELASIRGDMESLRARNGGQLSEMDRGRLQERLDTLSRSIHWMRENGGGSAPGVGGPPPMGSPPMAGGAWTLERREAWMQQRLDRARTDGSLARRDIWRAQARLNGIRESQSRMMRDGRLDDRERMMLQGRLDQLRDSLRWARQEDAPPWRR